MRFTRELKLLFFLFFSFTAHAQQQSKWVYMFPNTEDGKSKKEMIELYIKKQDYHNAALVAKFAMKDEPKCFYFADRYVQSAYLNQKPEEVVGISDSLLISPFSEENTFIYNAWIHNFLGQDKIAISVLRQANQRFPESETILKVGMDVANANDNKGAATYFQRQLLNIDPNNFDVYFQKFKEAVAADEFDDAIIYGETALISDPKNRENPVIKRQLLSLYNNWLGSWKKSSKYTCFKNRPSKLKGVKTMDDFLLLQDVLVFNYDPIAARPIETRLFDYKLKVLKNCNWIASWYSLYGSTVFPYEYDDYIKTYGGMLVEVNDCLSKIELSELKY